MRRTWFAGLLVAPLLVACAPTDNNEPVVPSQPCCHILVAPATSSTTINIPVKGATRLGPEPDNGFTVLTDVIETAVFPTTDVAQAAEMGEIAPALRESHEVYVVGLNLGAPPPGIAVPGTILVRTQDNRGAWGSFFALSVIAPDPANTTGGPLGSNPGYSAEFRRVGAAMLANQLEVCAVPSSGRVNVATRRRLPERSPDQAPITEPERWAVGGNVTDIWTDVGLSGGGSPGAFIDVGCAGIVNGATGNHELHVCAATTDGRLWHSVRTPDGMFTPFADIEGSAGTIDDVMRVSCVANGGSLYVGTVTKREPARPVFGAFMTVRSAGGTWTRWVDIKAEMTGPLFSDFGGIADIGIGFCNAGVTPDGARDVSQLNIVLVRTDRTITHTVFTPATRRWASVSPLPESSWMLAETIKDTTAGQYVSASVVERPFL